MLATTHAGKQACILVIGRQLGWYSIQVNVAQRQADVRVTSAVVESDIASTGGRRVTGDLPALAGGVVDVGLDNTGKALHLWRRASQVGAQLQLRRRRLMQLALNIAAYGIGGA